MIEQKIVKIKEEKELLNFIKNRWKIISISATNEKNRPGTNSHGTYDLLAEQALKEPINAVCFVLLEREKPAPTPLPETLFKVGDIVRLKDARFLDHTSYQILEAIPVINKDDQDKYVDVDYKIEDRTCKGSSGIYRIDEIYHRNVIVEWYSDSDFIKVQ